MDVEPCRICGSSDLNLVDGYYYCAECGTQDVNVRETVIEHSVLADGTWAHVSTRKFTTTVRDGIEMSSEWYRWHAYNFMLAGLTEELISLGAQPSIKMKVLWIWTRYIKKFQIKEDTIRESDHNGSRKEGSILFENENESESELDGLKKKKSNPDEYCRDIKIMTKGVILAILYAALNLNEDDMQLSHLFKFIRENRLSLFSCVKFVPKEINLKTIPHWKNFMVCHTDYKPRNIRSLAMTLFKRLDLGVPLVPDFRKLISDYIKELALPNAFKHLVFSLMNLLHLNFLDIDRKSKESLVRIPDFEGVAMTYILLALKMCFGLDDAYEIKLSDLVEKINYEKGYVKSYKLGLHSDSTERLFSFREWCNYLQFRKNILCKHYLPLAQHHGIEIDDYVFMEHLKDRQKRSVKLSDEVTMDILNKLPQNIDMAVIPKSEFPPTLTPLFTYTEVVVQYIQDLDTRLLLCEDFSQYSLKYACKDLIIENNDSLIENLRGVSNENKTFNRYIIGTLTTKKCDSTLVFVRNCENKNWLKTNPPSEEHIKKSDDSDKGYESNNEIVDSTNQEETYFGESSEKFRYEVIEEEDEDKPIFDDIFEDIQDIFEEPNALEDSKDTVGVHFELDISNEEILESEVESIDNKSELSFLEPPFDPANFNREEIITDLVKSACKKYKIPIPIEYKTKEPRKRKPKFIRDEADSSEPKKAKGNQNLKGELRQETDRIISLYYSALESDILSKISDHLKTVVQGTDTTQKNITIAPSQNNINLSAVSEQNENNQYQEINDVSVQVEQGEIRDKIIEEENDHESHLDLMSMGDPNFDETVYDVRQLYVKFKNEIDIDNVFDLENDLEIEELIEKQVEKFANSKTIEEKENKHDSCDDDNQPLSVIKEENFLIRKKKKKLKLESLITNRKKITQFNYWIKHYQPDYWNRNIDLSQKFDLELRDSFFESFNFIIHECAAISESSPYSLYKCLQKLEKSLISIT